MYTKDLPYTDRCRGIYVITPDEPMIQQVKPIPSLKILSSLTLVDMWSDELRVAMAEYYNWMENAVPSNIKENNDLRSLYKTRFFLYNRLEFMENIICLYVADRYRSTILFEKL